MKTSAHVVYGLFRDGTPRIILYVGSTREDCLVERLGEHRAGRVKTTAKMAARAGFACSSLRLRVFRPWICGKEPSPEGRVARLCQALGMARWNGPYTFSSEDNRKGGRIGGPIVGRRNVESGHLAGVATPESRFRGGSKAVESGQLARIRTFESRSKGGRTSGRIAVESGQFAKAQCMRWHGDRPKNERGLCAECQEPSRMGLVQ